MTSSTDRRIPLRTVAAAAITAFVTLGCWATSASAATADPVSHQARAAGRWAMVIAAAGLLVGLPAVLLALQWLFVLARSLLHEITGLGHRFAGDAHRAAPKRKSTSTHRDKTRWISPIGFLRGVVIGEDGRFSTSKVGATVWTYAVASALFSLVIAKWLGHPQGLDAHTSIQTEYAVLVGGPLGAAILAKGIVTAQLDNAEEGASVKPPGEPDIRQLVTNDSGETDLGDLQYVLFNTIALVFFLGEFFRVPTNGLPNLPDLLVGLTSVSAVGYVAKKALPTSHSADLTGETERELAAQEGEDRGITARAADLEVGDTSRDQSPPPDDSGDVEDDSTASPSAPPVDPDV